MSLIREIHKVNARQTRRENTDMFPADVLRVRESNDHYDIQLRNGGVYNNVVGPIGYQIGDTVTVFMKGSSRPVILGKGYRNLNSRIVVSVSPQMA